MKLTRVNLVLLLLVLALVGVDLLRGGERPRREIGRLFPAFFADQAQRIEIEGPDGQVRLDAGEAGWVCTTRFDHPARADWTARLLRALASLTTLDLLTEEPERHGEYGLGEGHTRVRVWTEAGDLVVDLVQGDDAPDSRACYVRRFGDDAIYRAPQLTRVPAEPPFWLEPAWMPFESTIVKAIRIESADLEVPRVIEREEKRYAWREGERAVAKSRVDDLLQAVQGLYLSDVVAMPAQGDSAMGEVALRLELTLLDERVLVGEFAAPEAGSVRARRRDPDGWVVTLPASGVNVVVERALGL